MRFALLSVMCLIVALFAPLLTSIHRRMRTSLGGQTPPDPIALISARSILSTPLNIFQICAWNHGTEKTEPWRRRLTDLNVVGRTRALFSRLREWCAELTPGPVVAVAILLIAVILVTPHLHAASPTHGHPHFYLAGLTGLKAYRDRDADLKGQIAKAKKDKAAIGDACVTEKRAMTDAERTAFAAFTPTIAGLEAQLSDNSELLTAAEAANEAERTVQALSTRATDHDAVAATAAAQAAGIVVGDSEAAKISKSKAFLGHALHAVRRIAMHEANATDRELVKIMAGPTGANSDVPSEGGFLIAPEQSNTIVQRSYDTGLIASLVTRQPVSGNALNLPAVDETSRANGSRFGGISSTWIGQGTTVTAGKPKFRLMELKLKKLLAFVYGTDELVADAVAFGAFIDRNLPLELNFATEDAIINGDGSNKPQGILNSGALVSVTRDTSSRVKYEDVSGMWKRMWAPLRKSAVWIIDQSVEQELEQISIALGTAGVLAPIYRPAGISVGPDGTQGYSPATLYGRPILTTEYNAALGTAGDIILGNLGEYTLIDKGNVEQAVSLHVAFLTDEAVWRFTYRADGQLNWNKALTPKSGGDTLSAVVALTT